MFTVQSIDFPSNLIFLYTVKTYAKPCQTHLCRFSLAQFLINENPNTMSVLLLFSMEGGGSGGVELK
jgi:hypothetical protein